MLLLRSGTYRRAVSSSSTCSSNLHQYAAATTAAATTADHRYVVPIVVHSHQQQQQQQQQLSCRFYHELAFMRTDPSPVEVLKYNQIDLKQKQEEKEDDDDDQDPILSEILSSSTTSSPAPTTTTMVKVNMYASPWNPADYNTVQGRYFSPYNNSNKENQQEQEAYWWWANNCRQSHYFDNYTVAGSEGIGRISKIVKPATNNTSSSNDEDGNNNNNNIDDELKVGDWVTFGLSGYGTMRSSLWVPRNAILKINRGQELIEQQHGSSRSDETAAAAASAVATLFQLGGTATRLLQDFLPPDCCDDDNDEEQFTIIQNGGNSGVAVMLSQIAKILYPNSSFVSFIRRGSQRTQTDIDQLIDYLTVHGKNDMVIIEDDLLNNNTLDTIRDIKNRVPPIKLAFNTIGGESSNLLMKLLGPSGTHVTYGGMSKKPIVTATTSNLVFQDLRLRGYWHSRWMVQNSLRTKTQMINELVDMVLLNNNNNNEHGDDDNSNTKYYSADSLLQCPPVQVFPLSEFKQALECDGEQSGKAIRSKIVFDCRRHREE